MVPFLVPTPDSPVAPVGAGPEEPLKQVGPASGGRATRRHYTNIRRIEALARPHPLVGTVDIYKPAKRLYPTVYDEFGRATKYRQSLWDL